MDSKETLTTILKESMLERGLDDQLYKYRLDLELREVELQQEYDYFLDLLNKGAKFQTNDNNLFIPYLLGLCDDFDISQIPVYVFGECPDIDVDYLPIIQPYLKDEWAPKAFGRHNVCNIGNYGTFGLKMSLIDMVRLFGEDRSEILAITKPLGKDEDGKNLTWESALALHKELREYCQEHPDIADAARKLIGRNRSRGKHAGGLVICSKRIDDLVPLAIDSDGNPVSSWTEGLHDQDLQPVGLIKFDVLVVKDLLRIARCNHLIKQRHGISSICARLGRSDWTDTRYLNDPVALALANEGKTKGIFQFDGESIRELIKAGGVDRFEDLPAYSSVHRPGPMGMKMHERYIDRKRGKEIGWEDGIPDLMKPILSYTYGIMIYQEQVIKILNVVGGIPQIFCEKIRKAISKKNEKFFGRWKEVFIENAQKNLGLSLVKAVNIWDQISSFSDYGFNRSHAVAYSYITSRSLWQKAHYPLEFYTIALGLEQGAKKDAKTCAYKREAENFGIKVNRLDLNKSGVNFSIVDDQIYIGFYNIKGIGEEVAGRIVAGQPYTGLEDFLRRFGTDAKVLTPLIELGVFSGDRSRNKAFYEHFKELVKKNKDRQKRNFKTREKYLQQVKDLMPEGIDVTHQEMESFVPEDLEKYPNGEDMWAVVKKYQRSVWDFNYKETAASEKTMKFENFRATELLPSPDLFDAEKEHYGFCWEHQIEKSPDYIDGRSFAQFDDEECGIDMVQIMITKKPQRKESKKGNVYYGIVVEDADRAQKLITIWEEDYQRFKEEFEFWDDELKRGNLMKIRLVRPGAGFSSFTFDSPPKRKRYTLPKDKEKDHRLILMRPPVLGETKNVRSL